VFGKVAASIVGRARYDIITDKKEGRILVRELVGYILIWPLDPRRSHGSSDSPRRSRLDPGARADVFIKAAAAVQVHLLYSCAPIMRALAAARVATFVSARPSLPFSPFTPEEQHVHFALCLPRAALEPEREKKS